ncbi:hypothetical protein GGI25_000843 [Coemansia spiralis]|uniref:Pacifastin domain-containing protein n=2 Tax=Coemansia TaxID=4863 RepID=A0A9W8GDE9_9FUNG|nr:hypothetical protein BX070DRAFT_251705 [Coemansia spiralis]KAJ1994121.1 hypothetical protein EDC05_001791 [Coemansia umbellata]KAJ2623580.1 hypothetical protein GGI26_002218 [Coemansia sp. RSA 1358]KAJ2680250.1 hypothetical protein GGI25_000843 [Coemansia spiralis]
MSEQYNTSDTEKLLGGFGPNGEAIDSTIMAPQSAKARCQHQASNGDGQCTAKRIAKRLLKITAVLIFTSFLLFIFARFGSNDFFACSDHMGSNKDTIQGEDASKHYPPHHPSYRPRPDCRTTGCHNGFECVKVNANIACLAKPCPSVVFQCLPPSMLDDPKDAVFSIQTVGEPSTSGVAETHNNHPSEGSQSDRKNKLTEAFFSCLQAHDGKMVWNHPVETCNLCRCLPNGGISCTKKLCNVNKKLNPSESASNSASSSATPGA